MGQELAKIKKRIKSATGAYKVTSALKLVSTVKLKSYRNKMLANRAYIDKVSDVMEKMSEVSIYLRLSETLPALIPYGRV